MNTGRADYDAFLRDTSIPSDEPRFQVRGQDMDGAETVRDWVRRAKRRGVHPAVLEQALKQADRMEAWEPKKVADSGHLDAHQAKRLAYEFERREWNLGAGNPEIHATEFGYLRGIAWALQQMIEGGMWGAPRAMYLSLNIKPEDFGDAGVDAATVRNFRAFEVGT